MPPIVPCTLSLLFHVGPTTDKAKNWAVVAVSGLNILFLGPPTQIPPGGRLDLGRITTDIDRKDVKVGPD